MNAQEITDQLATELEDVNADIERRTTNGYDTSDQAAHRDQLVRSHQIASQIAHRTKR